MQAPSMKASITATQTIKSGYKQYEKINESDWWWWYVAIDMPSALMQTGEVLYQFVTLTNPTTNASFTIGCYNTVGVANTDAIAYFKHDSGQADQLTSTSGLVTGKSYGTQAADLKEEPDDIKWKAGTTHVPAASQAPASATAGNTNYPCYFYEEMPKIGRNPNDFGITYNVKYGARIYKDSAVTTFDSVPESTTTISKPALATYVAQAAVAAAPVAPPNGQVELSMLLASILLFFSLAY